MIDLIKAHQQKIALAIGFAAVATIGFWGGLNINKSPTPKPTVSASSTTNYSQEPTTTQTTAVQPLEALNCAGKIKGSSSHKYHLIGGAFYTKTTKPIACFDTEAEAKSAGFLKSSR